MSVRELIKPGTTIGGRYLAHRVMGAGGMGAVYEATDTRLKCRVALKLMTNGDARAPAAFEQEARLLASLNHPALPRVTDYFSDERGQFLVMDYVDGLDLEQIRTQRGGRLAFAEVFKWAIDLLEVLEYLHTHVPPVIHRDIKPANLKVSPQGVIYLLDFGLAKSDVSTTHLSGQSLFAYTAQYAPLEQILGQGTSPLSDLFSLAATLYCLLAGTPPVEAGLRSRAVAQGQPELLIPLAELNPEVAGPFSDAIYQALELDARKRPTSAAVLRERLLGVAPAFVTTEIAAIPTAVNVPTELATTAPAPTAPLPPAVSVPTELATTAPAPAALRQVWFDPAERAAELIRLIEDFTDLLTTERVRETLGRDTISQIRLRDQQVRTRLNERFNLVVMGDFKRGKSTLVNALLGSELAPSNITPETVTINRFTYGPELSIVAHLANGVRMQLTPNDLRAERLEPLTRQLAHPIQHITIEAPIAWLEGLLLIDMPGTGDLDWRFDAQVQAYLPQADAIVYVISARAPLSASELAFLRRAVAPQEFPKLLFVVNQIDAIRNEADVERVIELVRSRVDQIFPGAEVYGLSSLDELNRRLGRNPPQRRRADDLAARFAVFRLELHESVLLNREIIRTDRAVRQAQALVNLVEEQASRLRTAMDRDSEQLQVSIRQCEDTNSSLRRAMQEQRARARNTILALGAKAQSWMNHFVDRVQAEVVAPLHQQRYADVQRHLTFYLQDVIARALAACIETHQAEIALILEQTRAALNTAVSDQTQLPATEGPMTAQAVARLTFNQATWSDVDTIHYVASFAQQHIFGAVGQMALALVFAAVDKRADDTIQLKAYQEQLRKALPALRDALKAEVNTLYSRLADEVDNQINSAYEADIASALNTLRQAESLQQAGTQRIHDAQSVCERLIVDAQAARLELLAFQRGLWHDVLA